VSVCLPVKAGRPNQGCKRRPALPVCPSVCLPVSNARGETCQSIHLCLRVHPHLHVSKVSKVNAIARWRRGIARSPTNRRTMLQTKHHRTLAATVYGQTSKGPSRPHLDRQNDVPREAHILEDLGSIIDGIHAERLFVVAGLEVGADWQDGGAVVFALRHRRTRPPTSAQASQCKERPTSQQSDRRRQEQTSWLMELPPLDWKH
jgi:hypothetical protein